MKKLSKKEDKTKIQIRDVGKQTTQKLLVVRNNLSDEAEVYFVPKHNLSQSVDKAVVSVPLLLKKPTEESKSSGKSFSMRSISMVSNKTDKLNVLPSKEKINQFLASFLRRHSW